jgi:hypothetical protein
VAGIMQFLLLLELDVAKWVMEGELVWEVWAQTFYKPKSGLIDLRIDAVKGPKLLPRAEFDDIRLY